MGVSGKSIVFEECYLEPSRNGLTKPKKVRGEGIKFANMGEIFANDRLNNADYDRVPVSDKERSAELLSGDLLFARQSLVLEGAGKCVLFVGDKEPVVFESHIIRVRLNKDILCPEYAFNYFRSPQGRSNVGTIVEQGAGASGVRGSDLSKLKVPVPAMSEQKAIAHILGTLDDKIELNRQTNQTLEAMAQALFKSWFVDFDPVIDNALAAGKPIPEALQARAQQRAEQQQKNAANGQPANPSDNIHQHFPDEFTYTDQLGWIPKGWKPSSLENFSRIQNGYAFKSNDWTDGGVPVVKIGSVKPMFVDLESASFVSQATSDIQAKFRLFRGDIVVGLTGYVGEVGRITNSDTVAPLLNQRVGKFEPNNNCYGFVYCCTRSSLFKAYAESKAHGSAQPNVSTKDLAAYPMPMPTMNCIDMFERSVSSVLDKMLSSHQTSKFLARLRDTLLPKLISGELRIPDAEKLVAEAGL